VSGISSQAFKFTKQLLGQKRAGCLICSRGTINVQYSDTRRVQPLDSCDALITPPELTADSNLKEPNLSEVEEVVSRARSSSAPSRSRVPHKVYKSCPKLLQLQQVQLQDLLWPADI